MSVCLCVHLFLGHFETGWDTLWQKSAFSSWEGSKATIFGKTKKKIWDLLLFFRISLRFLCNLIVNYSKTTLRRTLFSFYINGNYKGFF